MGSDFSMLHFFRKPNLFLRTVCSFIILSFAVPPCFAAVEAKKASDRRLAIDASITAMRDPVGVESDDFIEKLRSASFSAAFQQELNPQTRSDSMIQPTAEMRNRFEALQKRAWEQMQAETKLMSELNMPPEILERQQQAQQEYQLKVEKMRALLEKPLPAAEFKTALEQIAPSPEFEDLSQGMPFQVMQPDLERKPLEIKAPQELRTLTTRDNSNPNHFENPAFLASKAEIILTDEIKAKAAELKTPHAIYLWVRNNTVWQPTWGGQQTAQMTLETLRGNAMDISTLLIALFRAADIPARYVHGVAEAPADQFKNWVGDFESMDAALNFASAAGLPLSAGMEGGKITTVRFEHVWVEAGIDYVPHRGHKQTAPDTWLHLDPSFKQYEYKRGVDAQAVAGLSEAESEQLASNLMQGSEVNEAEGWVRNLNVSALEEAQKKAQEKLETHINALENPTVGDVIGGTIIKARNFDILPDGLPLKSTIAQRYSQLPSSLQTLVRLNMDYNVGEGGFEHSVTMPLYELNQRKLTISYAPASEADEKAMAALIPENLTSVDQLPKFISSNIAVIPEIKRDDAVILRGNRVSIGHETKVGYQIADASRVFGMKTYNVIAGSYLALGVVGTNMNPKTFEKLQADLEKTKGILERKNEAELKTITREQLLGDMFAVGIQGYYAQLVSQALLMSKQAKVPYLSLPTFGTFGSEPNQKTFFRFVRGIEPYGLFMNVYSNNIIQSSNNNQAQKTSFNSEIGSLSSLLESSVPEQLFTDPASEEKPDGFSAAKGIALANAQGQKIYTITAANRNVIDSLSIHASAKDEIRSAVALGKTVTTHERNINVPGYSGAAYIIQDDSGSGAYKITGSKNGGFISGFLVGAVLLSYMAFLFAIAVAVPISALFITTTALAGIISIILMFIYGKDEKFQDCFFSGLSLVVGIVTLYELVTILAAAGVTGKGLSITTSILGFAASLPSAADCLMPSSK